MNQLNPKYVTCGILKIENILDKINNIWFVPLVVLTIGTFETLRDTVKLK